jgi:hypothetical protein
MQFFKKGMAMEEPTEHIGLNQRARCFMMQNKFVEAKQDFMTAKKRNPEYIPPKGLL